MQHEPELMGAGQLHWLASLVEDGTATHDQAKELLQEFVRQVDAGKLSPRMIGHMRDCVAAYLAGRKTLLPAASEGRDVPIGVPIPSLEKAFGLKRVAPGQPKTDSDTLTEVAAQVLARRLDGESYDDAISAVAEQRRAAGLRGRSVSQVKEAWSDYQQPALNWVRIYRIDRPFNPGEQARLNELFWGKLWFCPPGVNAMARQKAILAEIDRRLTAAERARLEELRRAGNRSNLEAELSAQHAKREKRARAVARKIDAPFRPKNSRNT